MIQNFSTIVQQDIGRLIEYAGQKTKLDEAQQEKMGLATMRVFAAMGMVLGGILALAAVKVLVVSSVVGGAFGGGIAAIIYTLSHDIFVLAQNESAQEAAGKQILGWKALCEDAYAKFTGTKQPDDAPHFPLTEGTFYRPLWDKAIESFIKNQPRRT